MQCCGWGWQNSKGNRSWLVNVYKGKGDELACGSYRGIKLVE